MIRPGLPPPSAISAKLTLPAAAPSCSRSSPIFGRLTTTRIGSPASTARRINDIVPARNPATPPYNSASCRYPPPAFPPNAPYRPPRPGQTPERAASRSPAAASRSASLIESHCLGLEQRHTRPQHTCEPPSRNSNHRHDIAAVAVLTVFAEEPEDGPAAPEHQYPQPLAASPYRGPPAVCLRGLRRAHDGPDRGTPARYGALRTGSPQPGALR